MEERIIFHELGTKAVEKFGLNPHGKPTYRVVRSDSRREFKAGDYRPKYPKEKYGQCWILEAWCAPEKYGAEDTWPVWRLGPFPNHGDYEMSYAFLDKGVAYDPQNIDLVQCIVTAAEISRGQTRSERWANIQREKEAAEERRMQQLRDMIADARPVANSKAVEKYEETLKRSTRPEMAVGPSLSRGEA